MKTYDLKSIKIEKLKPYGKNSRTHSTEQIKQIMESIKAFSFTNPLLVDDDFNLIAGHGRLEAVKQLNKVEFAENPILEIPCIIVSGLSEAEQKALVIADNKIALNAGWDMEILGQELLELEESNFDLTLTGFNDSEIIEILGEEPQDLNTSKGNMETSTEELSDKIVLKIPLEIKEYRLANSYLNSIDEDLGKALMRLIERVG